jgi:formamidopyrimidine-DNA glycosylase
MPELPDVEGFRRYFARYAAGRRIASVQVADHELVRNTTPQGLGRRLTGRRFSKPARHGKWLIAPTGGAELLLHFGMTGLLVYSAFDVEPHRHDRVTFVLAEGRLRYRNMRRLGGIWLVESTAEREAATGPLGPDALDIDANEFARLLERRRGGIKSALMDQRLIAGLGNLLSDEILWRARIHPRHPVARLRRDRLERLHGAMRRVLRDANRHRRVPPIPGWLTGARDSPEPRCPRCGTRLRRATVAGRTAVWCPRCQRR